MNHKSTLFTTLLISCLTVGIFFGMKYFIKDQESTLKTDIIIPSQEKPKNTPNIIVVHPPEGITKEAPILEPIPNKLENTQSFLSEEGPLQSKTDITPPEEKPEIFASPKKETNIKDLVQELKSFYTEEPEIFYPPSTEIEAPHSNSNLHTITKEISLPQENNTFFFKSVRVSKVIDGDTIDVTDAQDQTQRVRIIGIDTPETKDPRKPVQCFGMEASQKAYELLFDKQVILSIPKFNAEDKYGRLLTYVETAHLPDYGGLMISEGYAFHYSRFPHEKLDEYEKLEITAQENAVGLWNSETCNGEKSAIETSTPPQTIGPSSSTEIITDCVCETNTKNCSHFKKHSEAQAYFDCCMRKVGFDIHKLDGDGNGMACESL